jgi:DNA-binding MarR family transcriptional regulator
MDRTSLYRAIAPMIRDGWIVSTSESRARFRTATVTKKGHRLLTDANRRWEEVQHTVIGKFGQKRYEALLTELNRLADCAV